MAKTTAPKKAVVPEKIIRWLHRGDTLYDVIIPEDAEVIDARAGYNSLKEKLEAMEKTPQLIYETIEG